MRKLLLLDENTASRTAIAEFLTQHSFEVKVADNSLDGLALARSTAIDLILCDLKLPMLDGYGFLSAIRQEEALALVPFILLAPQDHREDLRQAMELGADDYLLRPIAPEALLRAILSRLKRQDLIMQQVAGERLLLSKLKHELDDCQKRLQESRQLDAIKTDLLKQLAENIRNPLSNISMVVHMLRKTLSDQERDRYIAILQTECARELELLNDLNSLQTLLTPENASALQRFRILGRA